MGTLIVNPYLNGQFFLDTFPGAAAAYSLRQLSSTTTNVVRVRRSSDNLEQDFTASEVENGALTTWVGTGNNGFVTIWYDQSGNINNARQENYSNQPKIIDAGALLTINFRPAISFNGTSHALTGDIINFNGLSAFFVMDVLSFGSTIGRVISFLPFSDFFEFGVSSSYEYLIRTKSADGFVFVSPVSDPRGHQVTSVFYESGANIVDVYKNSTLEAQINQADTTVGVSAPFILMGTSLPRYLQAYTQEVILYPSSQLSSRVDIENKINSYYGIY